MLLHISVEHWGEIIALLLSPLIALEVQNWLERRRQEKVVLLMTRVVHCRNERAE